MHFKEIPSLVAALCGTALLIAATVVVSERSVSLPILTVQNEVAAVGIQNIPDIFAQGGSQLAAVWESYFTSYGGYPSPRDCYGHEATIWDRSHWAPPCYGLLDIQGGAFSASSNGTARSLILSSTSRDVSYWASGNYLGPAQDGTSCRQYLKCYRGGRDGEDPIECSAPEPGDTESGCHCINDEDPRYVPVSYENGPSGPGCYGNVVYSGYQEWAYGTSAAGGSVASASPGAPVTLEWSCQPYQTIYIHYCKNWHDWFGYCLNYEDASFTVPYSSSAYGAGAGFDGGKPYVGSQTVYPSESTTYSLYCGAYPSSLYMGNAGESRVYWYSQPMSNTTPPPLSISVTVPPPPPPLPTVSISGNGTNPTNVQVGSPVAIAATFAAGAGDALSRTVINDYQQNALTASTPPGNKTYSFTPTAPGSYAFYPAVQTSYYTGWNNYNQSLVITAACPSGTRQQGNSCITSTSCAANETGTPPNCNCRTGYNRSSSGQCMPVATGGCPANEVGTAPNCQCAQGYGRTGSGQCIATPTGSCPGAHQINPPSCTCEFGYANVGGTCVFAQCPGAHETNFPSCSCTSGYTREGGTCIRNYSATIRVNGQSEIRVQRDTPVQITWSAIGVEDGSCTVTGSIGGAISSQPQNPTPPPTRVVTSQVSFTLSCTNDAGAAVTATAKASLIPITKEI